MTTTRSLKLEPSARSYYTWSPTLIRSAEVSANGGNLRMAADLCEWMMGDDRVLAVLDTRCDALLGLPFELQAISGDKLAKQAAEDLGRDWRVACPDPELKKLISWGVLLGVGVGHINQVVRGDRIVPTLDVWSPRNLSWDLEQRTWMIEIASKDSPGANEKIPITAGDGEWVIYTPHGSTRPWVHGAYRALARWTLLKAYALSDWGSYSERLGQGVWVTETEGGGVSGLGTKDQRQELVSDLQGIGRNTAVALNPGEHLKLIESVARQQDNFRAQVEVADNGTAVAILGQNLTTQAGTGGTVGAASLHGRVLHGRTRVDGQMLSSCLREQMLRYWTEWSIGDAELYTPTPWWDTTPIDDNDAKARVAQMQAQADATLINAGVMTPNEVRAMRGLPPIEGGDVIMRAPPTPPMPEDTTTPQASATKPRLLRSA
jgi:phage gp29-like protein